MLACLEFLGRAHDALGPELCDDLVEEPRDGGADDDRLVAEAAANNDLRRPQHGHVLHHHVQRLVAALSAMDELFMRTCSLKNGVSF